MNGSTASASNKSMSDQTGPRDLIVSVNWIGDAIMAMPAVQLYRRLHPDNHIAVLARGVLADLWKLNPAPDEVIRYDGRPGIFNPLYAKLRASRYDNAWILPNSFRSALVSFRSGIKKRKGVPGGFRNMMLTEVIKRDLPVHHKHQAWEYIHLMNPVSSIAEIPHPELRIPTDAVEAAMQKLEAVDSPFVGMIPGAARGPSKRWPEQHFVTLAKRCVRDGCTVVLFGGPEDVELCRRMSESAGGVISLAGRTTFREWASLLSACQFIVANDSGGMHLAAALNVPVVALYGMTDPERTGPIGKHCVILQKSKQRMRDIPRNSVEAIKSLEKIRPEEVYEASRALIHLTAETPGIPSAEES